MRRDSDNAGSADGYFTTFRKDGGLNEIKVNKR